MARTQTISGEVITITETKATDGVTGIHWRHVSGTIQGILDYLNENKIPEHKVKGFTGGSTAYVLIHL